MYVKEYGTTATGNKRKCRIGRIFSSKGYGAKSTREADSGKNILVKIWTLKNPGNEIQILFF